jgi:uncharacterized surface protein with fasciclin (FAS1) repeats
MGSLSPIAGVFSDPSEAFSALPTDTTEKVTESAERD